eukprot:Protomagalhaensia_sp_Gyna_25__1571@NODE_1808_length_1514_cov_786_788475_g394_i2_p1_GENE_NODE_1808_length_1514_cov_786_788475_g394_i2NODE_1808_length_1514_cov_786_788475_g394_i2_p1_ORF_typecomplete_len291_score34_01PolyA_pol/PF01743_20/2e25PolyA_pol_RNAbd/PF12627_7/0_095_NODE_1808_length_1514_cov_786_788475_g394_i25941466
MQKARTKGLTLTPFALYLREFASDASVCPTTSPTRIAGGWVRDALLGTPASDFDVVVESCGGDEYAAAFVEWFNSSDERPLATLRILERNTDAFRHVKVGKVHVKDMKVRVDFTSARLTVDQDPSSLTSEERLRQDASHRDLTVNALYFNLHNETVEDPLGMGLADLEARILRTPIPAQEVLNEDPVRLIRFARFYATLPDFKLHEDIRAAGCEEEFIERLKGKIPAGRVKCECTRLLDAENALRGLYFLAYSPGLLTYLSSLYPLTASQKEWVRRTQIDSINTSAQVAA